ncbi:MAG: Enoyl-CoA hydratase/isomerase [Paucimonas sp.]|nr:Enoyl-CoA hydratase/isomerase [Paucimonas sp.]
MNAVTEAKYLQSYAAIADVSLPEFSQIQLAFDRETRSAWTWLKPTGRACFSSELLDDLRLRDKHFEANRGHAFSGGEVFPVEFAINASRTPGAFSFGGDLALFSELIRAQNRHALINYARVCIECMHKRLNHYGCATTTISLVQGDALGGGLECALNSDIVIAEESARMGFPEILFNLFPGMGAYSMLSRKVGAAKAEEIMLSGELYSARALHELGLVDVLVADGCGEQATHDWMRSKRRQTNGMNAIFRCREVVNPISYDELMRTCEIWVDAALRLGERDLKMMQRLVRAQERQHAPQRAG